MDVLNAYRKRAYGRDPQTLLPFDANGWMQADFPAFYMEAMHDVVVRQGRKEILLLEVGSWLGLSTRMMADGLRNNKAAVTGTVVAIDTWLGSPEHVGCEQLDTLYDQFVSNVMHKELQDYIIPFRISSVQAGHYLESKSILADVVYIDAGHEYESVKLDIDVFWRLLRPGGYMIFDDYAWAGVKQAVDEHHQRCGVEQLKVSGALAMIQKPCSTEVARVQTDQRRKLL